LVSESWTQSYDFDLQRQSYKFLQRPGSLASLKTKHILFNFENDVAYYKAGVVAVNSKVVGSALGFRILTRESNFATDDFFGLGTDLSIKHSFAFPPGLPDFS
jgi:hypothetical protein